MDASTVVSPMDLRLRIPVCIVELLCHFGNFPSYEIRIIFNIIMKIYAINSVQYLKNKEQWVSYSNSY